MKTELSIIAACMLIGVAGCGSELNYRVAVYDIDSEEARAEYDKCHPDVARTVNAATQYADYLILKRRVERFRDDLILLNVSAQLLPVMTSGDPNIAKIASRQTEQVVQTITQTFEGLLTAIEEEIKTLKVIVEEVGPTEPAPKPSQDLRALWKETNDKLQQERYVETDPSRFQTVVTQLSPILRDPNKLEELAGRVRELRLDVAVPELEERIKAIGDNDRAKDLIERTRKQIETPDTLIQQASKAGPTGILRVHIIEQDMSDPYIIYMANNPQGWRRVPNMVHAYGDGDCDFVLVFEDVLEGRWKTVELDPTAVIEARLRVSRVATKAIAALAGSVAASYGVPIPGAKADESKPDTVDFSVMTAKAQYQESMNDFRLRQLRDLREFAEENKDGITEDNVKLLTQRLQRRLSGLMLEKTLETSGEADK